jgi:glycosyltransferase involved in cell wall biosynthesis
MKVLYIASLSRHLSGGTIRSFEVLRRVNKYGITPVIVLDKRDLQEAGSKELKTLLDFHVYTIDRLIEHRLAKIGRSFSYAPLNYFSILKDGGIIARIAKKEKVDLIVSQNELPHYVLEAYYASKTSKVPWTCTMQLPLIPFGKPTYWRRTKRSYTFFLTILYHSLYESAFKALNQTIPLLVSPSIKFDMKIYAPQWQGDARILNPSVGVDLGDISRARPSKEEASAIYFARLTPSKGINDIPKVCDKLVRENPRFKLVVAGRFGSSFVREEFYKLITKFGLQNNVIYKGFLSKVALYSLLKSVRVFVYPSKLDAFPLTVLESLACGTPVVAYDIPAIRLNYQGIRSVKLVSLGDYESMAQEAQNIIQNEGLHKKLSIEGISFASMFSWDKVAEEEVRAYADVTNHANARL